MPGPSNQFIYSYCRCQSVFNFSHIALFALALLGCSDKGADTNTATKADAVKASSPNAAATGVTAANRDSATAATAATAAATAATAAIATQSPAATGPDSATASVATQSPTATGPGDANNKTVGTLLPGRSKQDQETFNAAIRTGERMLASWPKGPGANTGALLPQNRIIAYYGNPHSKKMGVIGEYPEQQMLGMLDRTVAQWKAGS